MENVIPVTERQIPESLQVTIDSRIAEKVGLNLEEFLKLKCDGMALLEQLMKENQASTSATETVVPITTATAVPSKKRIPWTREEEEKLREGVAIFEKEGKYISWKTIHRFGAGVFAPNRTPTNLKDKWRSTINK